MFNEILLIFQCVFSTIGAIFCARLGIGALYAFISLSWILGNLFVTKQVDMFGLNVVACDCFAICANVAITLLSRNYGQKEAQKSIYVGMFSAFFFVAMSKFHIMFQPNQFDLTHFHFDAILGYLPRIILTSLFVSVLSMSLNLKLYNYFSRFNKYLNEDLKTGLALFISQFLDTVLFTIFALYGSVASIWHIIFFSYFIKCIAIVISIPIINLSSKFIKPCQD